MLCRPIATRVLPIVAACGSLAAAGCSLPSSEPSFDLEAEGLSAGDKSDTGVCDPYPGGPLSGDDLLVLVNKQPGQQLSEGWAPRDLVPLPDRYVMPERDAELRLGVAEAFMTMADAAEAEEGLELVTRSAYRSFTTQCYTFDYKVRQHGIDHARRFSAEPGRSQHQLGTTVDITSASLGFGLGQSMGDSAEGQWLESNAHRFGFALAYPEGAEDITGYAYEPWHFRYLGLEAAFEMELEDEILETYLQRCQDADPELACPREELPQPVVNDGWIGGTCETADECSALGPGARCLGADQGHPLGHCSLPCTAICPDRAGANAVSVCLETDAGGLCHSRCDFELFPASGCRDGYHCVDAPRPQGDSAAACVPQ